MKHLLQILLLTSFVAFDSEIPRLQANEILKSDIESNPALISSNTSELNISKDGLKNPSTVDSNKLDQVERDHSKGQIESVTGIDRDSRKEMKKKKGFGEVDLRVKGLENQEETSNKDVSVRKMKKQQQQQVSQSEDCDPSNRCAVNDNSLIACMRVPGSESSDLSLLIQNKGKGGLEINISAPNSVRLEKKQVNLQEKENIKVKVSITKSGSNEGSMIVLSAGNGDCNLDIKDLITQYSEQKEVITTSKFMPMIFIRRNPIIVSSLLVFLLLVTLTCTYLSFFRKKRLGSMTSLFPKYQRLDEEVLPVVSSGKTAQQPESNDGWDNGWGDNWDDDDEEAPTMPLTPSLSSKGLASRKLNKDGWKD
ncbi:uncharacterized protein LOC124941163 [Impatiens glandulifera]|uniref:uncharacterized protein LOC124941163 n=1 Tax=Impatiens glandulifera TaxID=253017 RepID=UPI001FB1432F|nr:uncharacterized protein LOC124941163 [Impatiens glandulifera]